MLLSVEEFLGQKFPCDPQDVRAENKFAAAHPGTRRTLLKQVSSVVAIQALGVLIALFVSRATASQTQQQAAFL